MPCGSPSKTANGKLQTNELFYKTKNYFISAVQRTPKSSPVKSSQTPKPHVKPSPPVIVGIHPVPSPEVLASWEPREGQHIQGFYLVTKGQECGIFFSW